MKSIGFTAFWIVSLLTVAVVPGMADDAGLSLTIKPVNHHSAFEAGSAPFPGAVVNANRANDRLPAMFAPDNRSFSLLRYPWKKNIRTTVFWVGEKPTANNPVPNTASSWDTRWEASFGGYDDPDPEDRHGYLPKEFIPRQNPFYIALPYNDVSMFDTKASARRHVPWFDKSFYRAGKTILKGRWIAIRRGGKICYAQWEDCGPFNTDDWRYVFGDAKPKTRGNGGAGLDVSPAVRDYLGFRYSTDCDWRFVALHEVPDGPWKKWGDNNPFALATESENPDYSSVLTSLAKVKAMKAMLPESIETADEPGQEPGN